ncbi:MAG: amidohydrolase [Bacteroidota bacterium]|nr:amidohydrolase [Bacteroidota bacterium]
MKCAKLLVGVSLLLLTACVSRQEPADLIVVGGRIYTVTDRQPVVEGVAVRNGKIVFAGTEEEALSFKGSSTRIIDLQGMIMTPGFIEGHGHIMGVGYNELELDLTAVKSYDELVLQVQKAVKKARPGEWIVGRGWHQDKWDKHPDKMVKGFQTHHLLSAISPDNPVFLSHASGHAALANAKAMEVAGVNQLSAENLQSALTEEGGEIIRDELGNPTGIFNENAMDLIARYIPENESSRNAEALKLALDACLRNGLTGFHDAGASQSTIDLFKEFRKNNKLSVRLYVMLGGARLARQWFASGPEIDSDHFLTIRSIKLSCDGALGSRGAWLLEPYTDRPDFSGMATLPMDTVLAISREALKHGFQVCSHAIGDRANREVLNQYERALKENPEVKDHRFRIEHAQHLNPSDIPRFAALGVIPSMQAIHMSSDRPWAIERLGEKRIREGAYMWQSLLKSGARVMNGTDAPVEPLNPVACFYAAVTRKTLKGVPSGGYEPEQKMTRDQALRSYTRDAAYGAFQEDVLGSIEVGHYADFTVFSKDIMTVKDDEILSAEVQMTIINGQVVYTR